MPLVTSGTDAHTSAYGMLDNRFQVTTYRERKTTDGLSFKKCFIYNSAANIHTIFTEPNEEMVKNDQSN